MNTIIPQVDTNVATASVNLSISPMLESKIDYLCKASPNLEWSGLLVYRVDKSDFSHDQHISMDITAFDVIPMDQGSGTYTEFEFNKRKLDNSGYADAMIDYFNDHIDYIDQNILVGGIHSHNVMQSFFSCTDISELTENCKSYNFYLSLIVNNAGDRVAKIAFSTDITTKTLDSIYCRDEFGDKKHVYNTTKAETSSGKLVFDVTVFDNPMATEPVPDEFKKSFEEIIKDCEERRRKKSEAILFSPHKTRTNRVSGNQKQTSANDFVKVYPCDFDAIDTLSLIRRIDNVKFFSDCEKQFLIYLLNKYTYQPFSADDYFDTAMSDQPFQEILDCLDEMFGQILEDDYESVPFYIGEIIRIENAYPLSAYDLNDPEHYVLLMEVIHSFLNRFVDESNDFENDSSKLCKALRSSYHSHIIDFIYNILSSY